MFSLHPFIQLGQPSISSDISPPPSPIDTDDFDIIVEDPTDKITRFVQGSIIHRKGIQAKSDELNREINFLNLCNIPNFQWKQVAFDLITPRKLLKRSQVDAALKR